MMQNEIQLLVQITAAHVRATALGLYTTQNSSGVGIGFPVHPPPPLNSLIPTLLNRKKGRHSFLVEVYTETRRCNSNSINSAVHIIRVSAVKRCWRVL